jgi:butyrate kinase
MTATQPLILSINPGSTSTKIAAFRGTDEVFTSNIEHQVEELSRFNRASDQDIYRMEIILNALKERNLKLGDFQAFVGRGGLLKPIEGGTYRVNQQMLADLKQGVQGDHPSNCGGLIAYALSKMSEAEAYIVDPVVVDELEDIARISGMPLIQRKSIFHALNQKAVAREMAQKLGKRYDEIAVIVAHLGGGITVGAHKNGRVIDVNNGLDGDGPFSPERSGGVPIGDLVKAVFTRGYTLADMKKLIKGHGGMVAYLGTNNVREVEKETLGGNAKAKLIYEAMAYQVAKDIGALSTVLMGKVDGIALTGGIAHSDLFSGWVEERVQHLAPFYRFPGEEEMRSLMLGALRVLKGEEAAKIYQ